MHDRDGAKSVETVGQRARQELLAATPVTERRLMLAGISTAVLVGGDGPPIVLLHGPGEFALTWLRVVPELVETNNLVIPDLPGHGATRPGKAPLDKDRVLSWVGELIERTCPSPPYFVGHLFGGAIGARFAIAHSEKLRGLVLVDTFGLCPLRPSPLFTLTLINFLARPTAGSRNRFFRQCFVDMNRLQDELGPLWQPLMTCALEGASSPDQKPALRSMLPQFGWRAIPEEELASISVPRPSSGGAMTARPAWPSPSEPACGTDGRCTSSKKPRTILASSNPRPC